MWNVNRKQWFHELQAWKELDSYSTYNNFRCVLVGYKFFEGGMKYRIRNIVNTTQRPFDAQGGKIDSVSYPVCGKKMEINISVAFAHMTCFDHHIPVIASATKFPPFPDIIYHTLKKMTSDEFQHSITSRRGEDDSQLVETFVELKLRTEQQA